MKPRVLLAVFGLLFVSGCFDLTEEIWFEPTTTRMEVGLTLSERLVKVGKLTGGDPFKAFDELAAQTKPRMLQHEAVTAFDSSAARQAGEYHFVYYIELNDPEAIPDVVELIQEAHEDDLAEANANATPRFVVERHGMGRINFRMHVGEMPPLGDTPTPSPTPFSRGGDPVIKKPWGEGFTQALIGERFFTVRVHGADVRDTNGVVSNGGKTVEWKIPIAKFTREDYSETLSADLGTLPRWMVWSALGAGAFLFLALAVGLRRAFRR